MPKITALCGGIGGTKLIEGLAAVLPTEQLSVIGNIGDDDEFHGLWVSPDIDILTCSLAGLINRGTGWGLANDSFRTLDMLKRLGAENTWMNLGDQDLAIHIYRTQCRNQRIRPSEIARDIAAKLGVITDIILPADDPVQTRILSDQGWLNMETYFVRERCQPRVLDIHYANAEHATPTPEAIQALETADVILFAPSNPLVSIGPILSIPGIETTIQNSSARKVAVSPLINNQAIKGPTCEMMQAMGFSADLVGLADCYQGMIDTLVIDSHDRTHQAQLEQKGLQVLCQNILMKSFADKKQSAQTLLHNLGF